MSKAYIERVKAMIRSKDPKTVELVQRAGQDILNLKMLGPTSVHVDSALSNVSIQYKNEDYIGLDLMPLVTVQKPSDKYFIYSKRDRLAMPDASVGTRSRPNEVSETRSTANYSCGDYALVDFIDEKTLRSSDAPLNEMVDLIASVNDAIELNTESKIATKLTTAANFPTGNKVTLSGGSRWDTSSSDPVADIQTGIDALYMGPGPTKVIGYTNIDAFRVLSRHPKILDGMKYVTGGVAANRQQLAAFLGLDDLLVGKARQDTANIGQTASYSRLWTKSFGIVRVAQSPGIRTASFGYTFRFGPKQTFQWFDQMPGVSGGYWGKVGVSEDYNIVASDVGYFLDTVIS